MFADRCFVFSIALLIAERLAELMISRRNETRMKREGYREFGRKHYPYLVTLHIAFFCSMLIEASLHNDLELNGWALALFVVAQAGRVLVFIQLGRRFTTRVLVTRGESFIANGLYRVVRHPNYLVVVLELLSFPMIFGLRITAFVFGPLVALMLIFIRIPTEERARTWAEGVG